jgi:prepilin-type N-terminal cleavage/methylation domain-containing protein
MKRGFTLIELLVVCAIISIGAAICFPAMMKAAHGDLIVTEAGAPIVMVQTEGWNVKYDDSHSATGCGLPPGFYNTSAMPQRISGEAEVWSLIVCVPQGTKAITVLARQEDKMVAIPVATNGPEILLLLPNRQKTWNLEIILDSGSRASITILRR